MNTLAPLPPKPEAGMVPTRPVLKPNTPPWLKTVSRRAVGSSVERVADKPPPEGSRVSDEVSRSEIRAGCLRRQLEVVRVKVEERLRATSGDAGKLNEGFIRDNVGL